MNQEKPGKKAASKKAKPKRSAPPAAGFMPSLQSMESLLSGIGVMARKKPSAVDEAQDVMYDAWEATTRKQRVALAKKAMGISADCADAYVLLAEETARSLEEAIDLYRKGVEAGERALGKKLFKEEVGYFWGLLETRPYMRARLGLAQCMWEAGNREAAIEHYWDMLRLNPNDNQGIRDLLMPCLLELGRDKDAEKLFRQYKEDGMAVWMYSRTLLDFRKHGPSPIADKSLKAAMNENKHVPAYLLGRKKMPPNLPEYYGFGDENEAVLFARGNKTAWKATPGAMEWLAAKVK
jgi:tetratricopeptide (TPR) repeat protein